VKLVVVGAGIVGLATARQLAIERPDSEIVVLEKEPDVARHQTGHNSGVIHAGIYYPPGSLKAQLCRRGVSLLKEFCRLKGVRYQNVGKLVVGLDETELDRLDEIHRRARANGVSDARLVGRDEIAELEPHAAGIRAVHSPSTAIVDYVAVSRALAADLIERGGQLSTSTTVLGMRADRRTTVVLTDAGELLADEVVVCAGLQSSRLAKACGEDEDPLIVPFRGEYYRLPPERAGLVRGLIYPVPDPRYPFLGIHLTRRIDGAVDVGPNAVLATALQGYRRRDLAPRDLATIFTSPGFRKMARQHWRTGMREMRGSLSKRAYLAQARRYLPELGQSDLRPAPAGVRAQAVARDGQLVDDFAISRSRGITFVRNAPSPAATSCMAIAEHIVRGFLDSRATGSSAQSRPQS
jgi:L-2-hydroxyglutarate oxidase LhgO